MARSEAIARWTPRPTDIALAAAMLVAAEAEQALGGIGGPRWVAATCGAIAALAIAWRHLAPVAVTWIVAVALVVPLFAGVPKNDGTVYVFPILIAMFALGQESQRNPAARRWGYITLAGTATLAASAGAYQEGLGGGDFLYVGALAAVPYLFGRAVGASRRDSERHARRAERAVAERETARLQAVAQERLRIARELHDVISHSVSLMGLQAGAARTILPAGHDAVEEILRSIEGAGRDTLEEMRRLLGVMREDGTGATERAPQPGVTGIDDLVTQARSSGVPVVAEVESGIGGLSPGVDLVAYRIVQEGLTNARRHAPGAEVTVRVRRHGGRLQIEVSNPAPPGAAAAPEPGHGILGMAERAALYDGTFSAGAEGGRFVVRCALPIEPLRSPGLVAAESP